MAESSRHTPARHMQHLPKSSRCVRLPYANPLVLLLLACLLLLILGVATAVTDRLDGTLPTSHSLHIQEVSLDVDGQLLPANKTQHDEPKVQAEQLYQSALELYSQGKVVDAIALAERAAALTDAVVYLFFLAQATEQLGELDTALQFFQRALQVASTTNALPLEQEYWLNFRYAELLRRHAIPRATTDPRVVDTLKMQAIEHYQRALAADRSLQSTTGVNASPNESQSNTVHHMVQSRMHILNTIGVLLNDLQRFRESVLFFEQAIEIDATTVQPLGNLALALTSLGEIDAALQINERALALAPDQPRLLHNTGLVLQSLGRDDEAVDLWKRANALSPSETETISAIAGYYADKGDMRTCRSYLQQAQAIADAALQREPRLYRAIAAAHTNRVRLANAQLPLVYHSVAEIADARSKYEDALRVLLREPSLLLPDPLSSASIGMAGYYAEYQGFNDASIRAQLAQIYRRGSPVLSFTAAHVREGRDKLHRFPRIAPLPATTDVRSTDTDTDAVVVTHSDRKIRVGFHSAFMRHHSVGLLTQGVITQLSRDAFEVVVIVHDANANAQDELTARVFESADRVVLLPRSLVEAQQQVAALELDVLVFTEIGMDQSTYFLAFSHLALRTALFWGHAVTSGIDSVDYFVSSTLFEHAVASGATSSDDNQQAKFTECVYEMQHLTTHFLAPAPASPAAALEHADSFRESLGLPPRRVLSAMFLIPQTLYKLHPDMDALIERILRKTPAGFLTVLTGFKPWLADEIRARWRRMLSADIYRRIYFVRALSTQEFLDLCAVADVVLDPFPVGGGRSSFEVFSVGTPIVMLASRTSILQLTAAMYKIMGIDELIAATDEEYVALAVRLALEPTLRAYYRRLVVANKHKLFESEVVVREWERFLVAILAARPPSKRSAASATGARTRAECPRFETSSTDALLLPSPSKASPPTPEPLFEILITVELDGGVHEEHAIQLQTAADDPFEVARTYVVQHSSKFDWHHRSFSAKLLWNGKQRQTQPVVDVFAFDSVTLADFSDGDGDDGSSKHMVDPIEVRYGDDLHLVTRAHLLRELKRRGVGRSTRYATLLTATVKHLERLLPAFSSPQWIAARSFPLQNRFAVMSDPTSSAAPNTVSVASDDPRREAPRLQRDCLTLLITTCKRLELFLRMIASLERALGISTASEASAASGWSRWFCHILVIDDNSSDADRASMQARVPSESFKFYFKGPAERGHARSLTLGLQRARSRYMVYIEDDWEFTGSAVSAPTASAFLSDALAILRAHRTSLYEPLALVLLNDQQSGWERHLRVSPSSQQQHDDNVQLSASTAERTIRYFVHEYATSDPAHTFAFWPGFSFNPGVWDLHAITRALGHGDCSDTEACQETSPPPPPLFREGADLFEHDFSIRVWRSGLRVAYLDDTHAVHIGARAGMNASAYVLNGMPRRYDTPDYFA